MNSRIFVDVKNLDAQTLASSRPSIRSSFYTGSVIGLNGRVDAFRVLRWFKWLETKVYKMHVRILLAKYRTYVTCAACAGTRFKPESLLTRFQGATIAEYYSLPIEALRDMPESYVPPSGSREIAEPILERLKSSWLSMSGRAWIPNTQSDKAAHSQGGKSSG